MASNAKEFFEKFKNDLAKMKEQAPDAVNGFSGLFAKVMKDGVLSLREKELIALGIGVTQRCEPCIRLHVQKCLDAGATKGANPRSRFGSGNDGWRPGIYAYSSRNGYFGVIGKLSGY